MGDANPNRLSASPPAADPREAEIAHRGAVAICEDVGEFLGLRVFQLLARERADARRATLEECLAKVEVVLADGKADQANAGSRGDRYFADGQVVAAEALAANLRALLGATS